jgi:hypothetical protein
VRRARSPLSTPRLRSATSALVSAELDGHDRLAAPLEAVIPSDWPPEHHDAETLRFWREELLQPAAAGWWLYYILLTESTRPNPYRHGAHRHRRLGERHERRGHAHHEHVLDRRDGVQAVAPENAGLLWFRASADTREARPRQGCGALATTHTQGKLAIRVHWAM